MTKIYRFSHVRKKGPALLSISQAQPGRTFSQLSDLSFARLCITFQSYALSLLVDCAWDPSNFYETKTSYYRRNNFNPTGFASSSFLTSRPEVKSPNFLITYTPGFVLSDPRWKSLTIQPVLRIDTGSNNLHWFDSKSRPTTVAHYSHSCMGLLSWGQTSSHLIMCWTTWSGRQGNTNGSGKSGVCYSKFKSPL